MISAGNVPHVHSLVVGTCPLYPMDGVKPIPEIVVTQFGEMFVRSAGGGGSFALPSTQTIRPPNRLTTVSGISSNPLHSWYMGSVDPHTTSMILASLQETSLHMSSLWGRIEIGWACKKDLWGLQGEGEGLIWRLMTTWQSANSENQTYRLQLLNTAARASILKLEPSHKIAPIRNSGDEVACGLSPVVGFRSREGQLDNLAWSKLPSPWNFRLKDILSPDSCDLISNLWLLDLESQVWWRRQQTVR